jgi:peroxiredoxin
MIKMNIGKIAILSCALLISACFFPLIAKDRLIGAPAPDFTLPDLNSPMPGNYTLSRNFSGQSIRPVVVCFYASWCALCAQELAFIGKLADSVYNKKIGIVAVCVDSVCGEEQIEFVRAAGVSCPIVHDSLNLISRQYRRPNLLPYSVYINAKGIVVTTASGFSDRAKRFIRATLAKMITK